MGEIMDQEENLDLLDLEQDTEVDTLPEAAPFTTPRPKKPWLLMGVGIAIIILATWIVVARIGGDSGTTINVDLDTPVEKVEMAPAPVADLKVPEKPAAPVKGEEKAPAPKPVEAKPIESDGNPVRVVEDRKEVTFNPDKPVSQPKQTITAPAKKATVAAPKQTATASNGSVYVQFGSYSTRALAQAAEQKMRASHSSLFSGKQFVILAAQVKGQTTYRLRVAFHNATDANGFCRNAKSDGLDCYVTK